MTQKHLKELLSIQAIRAANVEIGDLVAVDGTVDEYHIDGYYDTKTSTDLPVTQINARDDRGGDVTVVAANQPLPDTD